jgi:AcrR family transcriptional regulator
MVINLGRYGGPMGRREQIVATAAELFAARGFHGVSVGDLGAACGVSGPAIYKHFASKEAILASMLVRISEELLVGGRERVTAHEPRAAVAALVDWHVDFALRHKALIVVHNRDWQSLPDEAREQVRRLQREYVDLWAGQLLRAHRGLHRDRARAMAHAAFGLINSTPHSDLLAPEQMCALLRGMALDALGIR